MVVENPRSELEIRCKGDRITSLSIFRVLVEWLPNRLSIWRYTLNVTPFRGCLNTFNGRVRTVQISPKWEIVFRLYH